MRYDDLDYLWASSDQCDFDTLISLLPCRLSEPKVKVIVHLMETENHAATSAESNNKVRS